MSGFTDDLERRLRAVESSGLPSMEKGVTTCWYRNPDGPEAADEIARLHDWLADEQMLATKWMEAHDKLKAGKPYTFPTPADLPNKIARLRAENEALREALEHIAALSDQREEPWPEGSEMDRLHFWRDRVIDAAEAARQALQEGSRHE